MADSNGESALSRIRKGFTTAFNKVATKSLETVVHEADKNLGVPVIVDLEIYVGTEDGYLHSIRNAKKGEKLWTTKEPVMARGAVPIVLPDDFMVIAYDHNSITTLDMLNGAVIGSFKTDAQLTSLPVVSDGMIYVALEDNSVAAITAATGKIMNKFDAEGEVRHIAVDDEILYFRTRDVAYAIAMPDRHGVDLFMSHSGERFRSTERELRSPMVVHGEYVYLNAGQRLVVLSPETADKDGKSQEGDFTASIEQTTRGTPIVFDEVVAVALSEIEGRGDNLRDVYSVRGYHFAEGEKWCYNVGETPIVNDPIFNKDSQGLYLSTATEVIGINILTGDSWRTDLSEYKVKLSAKCLKTEGKFVYFGMPGAKKSPAVVGVLDATTGEVKFVDKLHGVKGAADVIQGDQMYTVADNRLYKAILE